MNSIKVEYQVLNTKQAYGFKFVVSFKYLLGIKVIFKVAISFACVF